MTLEYLSGTGNVELNRQFYRAKANTTLSIPAGHTFLSIRADEFTVDDETHQGWKVETITNNTTEAYSYNMPASEASPVYYVGYVDSNASFAKSVVFMDKDDFAVYFLGGNSLTTAAVVFNWSFFPINEFDFTPFINQVNARLDA